MERSLEDLLHEITQLHHKDIDLGLTRMEDLLSLMGNQHHNIRNVIHIAGTNGKGSTIAFLATLLRANGFRVNTFTSPHLIHFCERITLHCKPWNADGSFSCDADRLEAEDIIKAALLHVIKVNNAKPLTVFEAITAAAFYLYNQHPADFTIIEVGLGGRFDATNVFSCPAATAITSIGLDHTEFLGSTISAIAYQKAGILKSGVPVILPSHLPKDALLTITKVAEQLNAPCVLAPLIDLDLDLCGLHQKQNAGIAQAIYESLGLTQANHAALQNTKWPGRMQTVEMGQDRILIIDGAHNIDGIQACVSALQMQHPDVQFTFFAHIKARKNAIAMINTLLPIAKHIYITDFAIDGGEAFSFQDIIAGVSQSSCAFSKLHSINHMQNVICENAGIYVALGSLFLAGEILKKTKYNSNKHKYNR